jgi:3-hydroxyisobutyrate dehydrogenase-like beta-hydroxyacid dehydrogenase
MPPTAWFSCEMMQKDLQLALSLAKENSVPMTMTALTDQTFTVARCSFTPYECQNFF